MSDPIVKRLRAMLAEYEEWRKVSHRPTEPAVDAELLGSGCFTCMHCRRSFFGLPASILKMKSLPTPLCTCRGCMDRNQQKEPIPCK